MRQNENLKVKLFGFNRQSPNLTLRFFFSCRISTSELKGYVIQDPITSIKYNRSHRMSETLGSILIQVLELHIQCGI